MAWENSVLAELKGEAEAKQSVKKHKAELVEAGLAEPPILSTRMMCPVEGCGGGWTQGNKWKHETTAKHVTAMRSCLIRSRQLAPTAAGEPGGGGGAAGGGTGAAETSAEGGRGATSAATTAYAPALALHGHIPYAAKMEEEVYSSGEGES